MTGKRTLKAFLMRTFDRHQRVRFRGNNKDKEGMNRKALY